MPENEPAAVNQTAENQDVQTVKIDRSELLQFKGRIADELLYLSNKCNNLADAMRICCDCFDAKKPENIFSLSTFTPCLSEIGTELDDLRESIWGRG